MTALLPSFCVFLLCLMPVSALGATKASPEVRQAATELATLGAQLGSTAKVFTLLRQAQPVFDADLLLPRQYLLECRRGRILSTLVGFYRADASYTKAHGEQTPIPLKRALEMLDLSEQASHALEYAWNLEGSVEARVAGQRVRQGVQDAALGLQNMNDVRMLLDIFYGMGLEVVYLATRTVLSLSPEAQTGVAMGPALAEVVRCLDLFRTCLQAWAKQPQLVKDLGVVRQLSTLDSLQLDVEMLMLQPSRVVAERILSTVNEVRGELAVLCAQPQEEKKGGLLRLRERDDLFKPRNFF